MRIISMRFRTVRTQLWKEEYLEKLPADGYRWTWSRKLLLFLGRNVGNWACARSRGSRCLPARAAGSRSQHSRTSVMLQFAAATCVRRQHPADDKPAPFCWCCLYVQFRCEQTENRNAVCFQSASQPVRIVFCSFFTDRQTDRFFFSFGLQHFVMHQAGGRRRLSIVFFCSAP